jgi:hypothetical protein
MTFERKLIFEELGWHFDDPGRAYSVMTTEERREVVKKGHLTKELRDILESRLASERED